jgi:hypothetical protein
MLELAPVEVLDNLTGMEFFIITWLVFHVTASFVRVI